MKKKKNSAKTRIKKRQKRTKKKISRKNFAGKLTRKPKRAAGMFSLLFSSQKIASKKKHAKVEYPSKKIKRIKKVKLIKRKSEKSKKTGKKKTAIKRLKRKIVIKKLKKGKVKLKKIKHGMPKKQAKTKGREEKRARRKGLFGFLFGAGKPAAAEKKEVQEKIEDKSKEKKNNIAELRAKKKAEEAVKLIIGEKAKKKGLEQKKEQEEEPDEEKEEHFEEEKEETEIEEEKPEKLSKKGKRKVQNGRIREIEKATMLPKEMQKGAPKLNYIKTGIPGFDSLLKQGVPEGASVLVEGGPGSGKTIFCLEVARNMCKQGKKVLYMSFEEPEYRLRSHLRNFGTDVAEFEKRKLLYIKRFNALDIARSVEALLSEAKKELLIDVQPVLIPHDFEPDIVLIDSLTSIGSAFSGEESRFRIYMEQLFRYLESHKITSFLIRETSNPTHIGTSFVERAEAVSFLSDGIIAIYSVFFVNGSRKRAIEIVKMRGVSIERKIVECEIIGKKGFIIYPNKQLSGSYRLT